MAPSQHVSGGIEEVFNGTTIGTNVNKGGEAARLLVQA
jgi:hypothetical protein